ncbi:protein of unknown function [Burkholderia multivorans]
MGKRLVVGATGNADTQGGKPVRRPRRHVTQSCNINGPF